jgi:hypothetical protein
MERLSKNKVKGVEIVRLKRMRMKEEVLLLLGRCSVQNSVWISTTLTAVFVDFLNPSEQMVTNVLNQDVNRFLSHPFQFTVY